MERYAAAVPEDQLTPDQFSLTVLDGAEAVGRPATAGYAADGGIGQRGLEAFRRYRRRQFRTSVLLFLATLLSTFLVGSQFIPLELGPALISARYRGFLEAEIQRRAALSGIPAPSINALLYEATLNGLRYAVPLMLILFCHEMGHFLQSVRYRVPASFPYFIPLPLPPLGTMGAVILQGRGVANRRQMFDIAVTGPLAGLAVTLPILAYGIHTSRFEVLQGPLLSMEFGEPLLLTWLIKWLHGPTPDGAVFVLNGYGFAGWVGVFITAMNLLPIGQLDGGHILYTLIGRAAHLVALLVIAVGGALMLVTGTYSYILLLILLMLTGARHPPTADDHVPLGMLRHLIGWSTLAFLIIGFTPQPIIVQDQNQLEQLPQEQQRKRRVDPRDVDPDLLVQQTVRQERGLLCRQSELNVKSRRPESEMTCGGLSAGCQEPVFSGLQPVHFPPQYVMSPGQFTA